jgi:hypothetical protein
MPAKRSSNTAAVIARMSRVDAPHDRFVMLLRAVAHLRTIVVQSCAIYVRD